MKVGIAVDDWKLPAFRETLTQAGYNYEDGGPLMPGATLLTIEADDIQALTAVVAECQAKCRVG